MAPSKGNAGSTSIIRKKLNFTDEALWRKFSSRRLQMVEALSLSSKKASEQDNEIRICARTLMNEFGFSDAHLGEFDKLVRFAIQSVRRNKRRSEKRLAIKETKDGDTNDINDHNINSSDEEDKEMLGMGSKRQKTDETGSSLKFLSLVADDDHEEHGANPSNNLTKSLEENASHLAMGSLIAPMIHQEKDRLPSVKNFKTNQQFQNSANLFLQLIKKSKTCFELSSKGRISLNYDLLEELGSSCVSSAVLLTLERWFYHLTPDSSSYIKLRLKSNQTLASLVRHLDATSVEVDRLSEYMAAQLFKKLLGACTKDFGFDSALNPLCDILHNVILTDFPLISSEEKNKSNNNYENFEFDENEHFADNLSIIDSFLSPKLNKHEPVHFTHSSPDVDFPLSTSHMPIPPANTFSVFNSMNSGSTLVNTKPSVPIINSQNDGDKMEISPVLSHINPPIIPTPQETLTQLTISALNSHDSIKKPLPTLPSLLNTNTITVTIKFQQKSLKFHYNMNTSAAPTLIELISNCKTAFGIINSTRVLHLRDRKTRRVFKSDYELESSLQLHNTWGPRIQHSSDFAPVTESRGDVELELVFTNVVQDYLNLNYETERPVGNPVKKKVENPEELGSRYLPPPRPPKRVFMKFTPLL
ncbi:Vhr1 protein [Martiniozyma asiatica (nom. inval.)]|nr:Vhr1 protein [Martiniozyma asiatica]